MCNLENQEVCGPRTAVVLLVFRTKVWSFYVQEEEKIEVPAQRETVQRLQCAWQRHLAGFRELLLASRRRCPLLGQGRRQTSQPGEREGSQRAAGCRETPGSAPATVLREAGVVQWSSYVLLFAGILALTVTEMGFKSHRKSSPSFPAA
ncbi:hypothetical protein LEMLEM_LOCUS3927, partial [Lemmus lemmus]